MSSSRIRDLPARTPPLQWCCWDCSGGAVGFVLWNKAHELHGHRRVRFGLAAMRQMQRERLRLAVLGVFLVVLVVLGTTVAVWGP